MYIIKQNKSGKWILIKKGAQRATKTFDSKAQAVAYAEAKKYKYDIAGTNVDNVARAVKKKPVLLIVLIIIFLIIIGLFIYLYLSGNLTTIINKITKKDEIAEAAGGNSSGSGTNHNHESVTGEDGITENIIYDDFQIHFMELGNSSAGDSVYIKAGDTDVLIDAGSESSSFTTTSAYINKYCTDKKFEYAIATHGDADHIASYPKFFQNYDVDICIDFSPETYNQFTTFKESGAKTRSYFAGTTKTTATYGNYLKARDQYAKTHYTAGQCFNNADGAKSEYQLSEYVTMTILYNYYYFDNDNDGKVDSSDENNFSVCTLFTYKKNDTTKYFILTGDLELDGETEMAKYYDGSTEAKTLPHVELYKAGHHGSKTSSNLCLLEKIQPKMCVACCCAGTSEYTNNVQHQFPTQSFINHISQYTSRVYVPSMIEKDSSGNWNTVSMNGSIIVSASESGVGLSSTNNLTKLKDSAWFNEEIYAVYASTYIDKTNGDSFKVYQNCAKSGSTDFYTKDTANAELIKRRYWPSSGVE